MCSKSALQTESDASYDLMNLTDGVYTKFHNDPMT